MGSTTSFIAFLAFDAPRGCVQKLTLVRSDNTFIAILAFDAFDERDGKLRQNLHWKELDRDNRV